MTWEYVAILGGSGAIGGFIASFRHPNVNEIHPPFTRATLMLGCVGEIIVGVVAAFVSYTLLGIYPTDTTTLDFAIAMKFAGWGAVAGYAGIKVLDRASVEMFRAKQEQLTKSVEVLAIIDEARDFLQKGQYGLAIDTFDRALKVDPNNEQAKIGLATARNFYDEQDHREPVKMMDEVIGRNPSSAKALYNRACIKALNLSVYSKEEVFADLRQAITIEKSYKATAANDIDFNALKDLPEFKTLTS